jgi:hypothetical protein
VIAAGRRHPDAVRKAARAVIEASAGLNLGEALGAILGTGMQ